MKSLALHLNFLPWRSLRNQPHWQQQNETLRFFFILSILPLHFYFLLSLE